MKQAVKSLIFRLLRKDPEAAVVSFCTGPGDLARRMCEEIRELVPDRRHFIVTTGRVSPGGKAAIVELDPGGSLHLYRQLRARFKRLRIGLAPVLFAGPPDPLRRAACLLAPSKILAYNANLERHHLRPSTAIASLLFLRGVPVDRIYLRPRWLSPWKTDRSIYASDYHVRQGRELTPGRARIAVLSPYVPYPLAHGGAVRIFHLLREAAADHDIFLFAFSDDQTDADYAVLAEFCARIVTVAKTRYREPRWSTLRPPEVHEFDSPAMRRALSDLDGEFDFGLTQIEYTQLAGYPGDILVEHDVTFDLYQQVFRRRRSVSALWNFLRWRRYELPAVQRFGRIVTMSEKDAALLGNNPNIRVIENGVDLARFEPAPETPGQRLLFIGSFRHFPNIAAYRFFTGEIWPELRRRFPEMTLTVVCGPDHLLCWSAFTGTPAPEPDERIRLLGFVRDVRPLYVEANIAIVPTTVSAGTNVKVLEAMAMRRAVVSTTSGCAGLGLEHRESAWIADSAAAFADGIAYLVTHPQVRARLAAAARELAERQFDWHSLAEKQRHLYDEFLQPGAPEPVRQRRRRRKAVG